MLKPFTLDVPGAKTLVVWIIARKVTVLDESELIVSTGKDDFLVKAHFDRIGSR